MRNNLIIIGLILFFIIASAAVQFVWLRIFKSRSIRLLPIIILATTWLVCVMGTLEMIDLPVTQFFGKSTMLIIPDYVTLTVIGIPVFIGIALGRWIYGLSQRRKKEKSNPEEPK